MTHLCSQRKTLEVAVDRSAILIQRGLAGRKKEEVLLSHVIAPSDAISLILAKIDFGWFERELLGKGGSLYFLLIPSC